MSETMTMSTIMQMKSADKLKRKKSHKSTGRNQS